MGLLSKFENRMEDGIEGAADAISRAGLSPVQITKKAEKQMRREKIVGAGKQYVPTLYTVLVSMQDDAKLSRYYPTLAGETETYLLARARELGFVMDGQPLVRFLPDPDLKRGKFEVVAEMAAASIVERLRDDEMQRYGIPASMRNQRAAIPSATADKRDRNDLHPNMQPLQNLQPSGSFDVAAVKLAPGQVFPEQASAQQPMTMQAQVAAQLPQIDPFADPLTRAVATPAGGAAVQVAGAPVVSIPGSPDDRQAASGIDVLFGEQQPSQDPAAIAAAQAAAQLQAASAQAHAGAAQIAEAAPSQADLMKAQIEAQVRGPITAHQVYLYDEERDRAYTLTGNPQNIGRESANDIVVPDINISRVHAQIMRQPNGNWIISDLGSTNGVFINGRKIQTAPLRDADMITIGTTTLEFQQLG